MALPERKLVNPRAARPHRWSRRQYESMITLGIFEPEERLELLGGEVLTMSPQSSRHATAVQLVAEALRERCSPGVHVRSQLPIALDDHSEPEPDVAVVRGNARDYREAHPTHAELLVEVADSSLTYDRGPKRAAYASNGIPEYWIVDLEARQVEVYRQGEGDTYRDITRLDAQQSVSFAGEPIPVAELLP